MRQQSLQLSRRLPLLLLLLFSVPCTRLNAQPSRRAQVFCHRTANREVPENTLESLDLAAHLGCDVVEIDIRRTLDGTLVLNHDGYLDRFTDTTGDIETTDLRELQMLDFGAWRGPRFRGMRLARFDDALRLARTQGIRLYLDIKTSGLEPDILAALRQEGMTDRVILGCESEDIRRALPAGNRDAMTYLQPGMTKQDIDRLHGEHKSVVGNFLSNGHEMDLDGMRRAVAAGVDALWVEYPRLGVDAAGRPVEAVLAGLLAKADARSGMPKQDRLTAVRELSHFLGYPLQAHFLRLLMDADDDVSHAAALGLVLDRPAVDVALLDPALQSPRPSARRNGAWALGVLASRSEAATSCAEMLSPLLNDADSHVLTETLVALARCPEKSGNPFVGTKVTALLDLPDPVIRSLASSALALYEPERAARLIPPLLVQEEDEAARYDVAYTKRGRPRLTQLEIDAIIVRYRAQMHLIRAVSALPAISSTSLLEREAFRPDNDFSNVFPLVAGYQLWDRASRDPRPALLALGSADATVADRAEWILVGAGPRVLAPVRAALASSSGDVRRRLIQILAWQGDLEAIPALMSLGRSDAADRDLIQWAMARIQLLELR